MCFVLYAGTSTPMALKPWDGDAPDLSVEALTEDEASIAPHFSKPAIQCVGSTSCCGCDFPYAMFQNGDWPWFGVGMRDPEEVARERYNREGLVHLLQATGEQTVELYGVWSGEHATSPAVREEIEVGEILDHSFQFKEGGYVVRLASQA